MLRETKCNDRLQHKAQAFDGRASSMPLPVVVFSSWPATKTHPSTRKPVFSLSCCTDNWAAGGSAGERGRGKGEWRGTIIVQFTSLDCATLSRIILSRLMSYAITIPLANTRFFWGSSYGWLYYYILLYDFITPYYINYITILHITSRVYYMSNYYDFTTYRMTWLYQNSLLFHHLNFILLFSLPCLPILWLILSHLIN